MRKKRSKARGSNIEPASSVDLIKDVQSVLRPRLAQNFLPEDILGFEEEKRQLQDVIRRTAVHGESNSVLIAGPRGGGKSVSLGPFQYSPKEASIWYCLRDCDQPAFQVKWVNEEVGRGVFATTKFNKGDFLVEYRGELLSAVEGEKREKQYNQDLGSYLYFFTHKGISYCIDATKYECTGRYLNDATGSAKNAFAKVIEVHNKPHIVFFASKAIKQGTEVRYDYGVKDLPWRNVAKVKNTACVEESVDQTRHAEVFPEIPPAVVSPETSPAEAYPESPQAAVYPESPPVEVFPESPPAEGDPKRPPAEDDPETPKAKVDPKSPPADSGPESPQTDIDNKNPTADVDTERQQEEVDPERPPEVVFLETSPAEAYPESPHAAVYPGGPPAEVYPECPPAEGVTESPHAEDDPETPKAKVDPISPPADSGPESPQTDADNKNPTAEVDPRAPQVEVNPKSLPAQGSPESPQAEVYLENSHAEVDPKRPPADGDPGSTLADGNLESGDEKVGRRDTSSDGHQKSCHIKEHPSPSEKRRHYLSEVTGNLVIVNQWQPTSIVENSCDSCTSDVFPNYGCVLEGAAEPKQTYNDDVNIKEANTDIRLKRIVPARSQQKTKYPRHTSDTEEEDMDISDYDDVEYKPEDAGSESADSSSEDEIEEKTLKKDCKKAKHLLKKCLRELENDEEVETDLLQVHLNGLLQTDDKIALREITVQLQLENTLGEKVFGSFAETLQFLLDSLKSGDQQSKPILFVLDEFDMFAQHRNQTLLYNLFDVAQSAQTPICVLGLTCRLDVIELLEKRVKSRFSHRQIHLFAQLTFDQYVQVFRNFLALPKTFPNKKFAAEWNSHVQNLSEERSIIDILKRQYSTCKEIRELQQLVTYPICRISDAHPSLAVSDFVESRKMLTSDSKSAILLGVSILELCLIISMKHITDIYDGEPFNFEMVYNEFQKFAQRKSSMQIFERAVVLKAYEHLMAMELVRPTDGATSKVQKEYRPMTLLIHPSQLTEALQKYPQCPTEVKQWVNSAIAT